MVHKSKEKVLSATEWITSELVPLLEFEHKASANAVLRDTELEKAAGKELDYGRRIVHDGREALANEILCYIENSKDKWGGDLLDSTNSCNATTNTEKDTH